MALAYVCLSDLHLGSPEGLLNDPPPEGDLATDELIGPQSAALPVATPALKSLAAGLRATLAAMAKPGDAPPTLVLMGDVMELGLTSYGAASEAVELFFAELFPAGQPSVFAPEIVYIPGNHDHHLWRMAQDRAFLASLEDTAPGARTMRDIPDSTPIFGRPPYESALMTAVLRKATGNAAMSCRIAYPNWGIADEATSRAVVIHHGHYIDTMYLAMSQFAAWMQEGGSGSALPGTAGEIERNNGAWVDFLWSDLGSAGNIAQGAETLYEIMMDGAASHRFARAMAQKMSRGFAAMSGTSASAPVALGSSNYGLTAGRLISAAVDAGIGQFAQGQREAWREVLSDAEIDTLRWYVAGPVANQIRYPDALDDEDLRAKIAHHDPAVPLPGDLTFVFGHTHKPFEDLLPIAGFAKPVAVFNTGGWEFRGTAPMPCHGGSAVLIDDGLNVAALRLYGDPVHDVVPPVHVTGNGYDTPAVNPLLGVAQAAVEAAGTEWAAFTAAIDASIRASIHARVRAQIPPPEQSKDVELAGEAA